MDMPNPIHGFSITFAMPQFATDEPNEDEDNLRREEQHDGRDGHYARGPDSQLVLPQFAPDELAQRIKCVEAELQYLHALRDGNRKAAREAGERWYDAIGNEGDGDE
jgi:hypothetical protein